MIIFDLINVFLDTEKFQKEVMPSHSGKHLPTRGKLKFYVVKDIKQDYNYEIGIL